MQLKLTYFLERETQKDYFRKAESIINRWWPLSCAVDFSDDPYFSATVVLRGSRQVVVGGSGFIYDRHSAPAGTEGDQEACEIATRRTDETRRMEIRKMKTISRY